MLYLIWFSHTGSVPHHGSLGFEADRQACLLQISEKNYLEAISSVQSLSALRLFALW